MNSRAVEVRLCMREPHGTCLRCLLLVQVITLNKALASYIQRGTALKPRELATWSTEEVRSPSVNCIMCVVEFSAPPVIQCCFALYDALVRWRACSRPSPSGRTP